MLMTRTMRVKSCGCQLVQHILEKLLSNGNGKKTFKLKKDINSNAN